MIHVNSSSTGLASPCTATIRIRIRWQPTRGRIDAATVIAARSLPGRAQAVKTDMSPPSLIPLITTRSGSAHSVTAEPETGSFGCALEARSADPETHVP